MIGTWESSFLPTFLLAMMALAVVVSPFCQNDSIVIVDLCNSTTECPVTEKSTIIRPRKKRKSPLAADCRIVLSPMTVLSMSSVEPVNVTPSAACLPWFAAGQPTNSSAAALRNSCSSARYQALVFFFTGDVVITFAPEPPPSTSIFGPSTLSYAEAELHPLCTAVINVSALSYVAAPLDFAGGGDCTSRLESPPGTVISLFLVDSQPRAGDDGGLSSECVCYSSEDVAAAGAGTTGTAASGCLYRRRTPLNFGSSVVTLTVKGDSVGLLCSAVIQVTVSPPPSVGKATRLDSRQLLLLLLLLCEAARGLCLLGTAK